MIYFVVEGKTDSAKLKSIFPSCETIETNGSEISQKTINLIAEVNKTNDVYVFTDPDQPGKNIRQKIIENIPNLKHIFIEKEKAIKNKKLGIAEAKKEDILISVEKYVTFDEKTKTITWEDFLKKGFIGNNNSKNKREKLCSELKIPYANGKTLFKWINMMGYKL